MTTIATFPSARRTLVGALVGVLLGVITSIPASGWTATHSSPGATAAQGAPIDSPAEALAAGGRRAPGSRSRTVVRHGIDVSHWQGRIDWGRVAGSGRVQFVVAKATEGTWRVDPMYRRNRALAQQHGLLFTAYHFANPSRERGDAQREADWFLAQADLRGTDLLPALDLEDDGGLTGRQLERWTLQWMRRVQQRLGVAPMLYTSPGFWSGRVGDSRALARAGFETLWLSHWEVRRPRIPARRWNGHGWSIWQWTERGSVPGIVGWVDRNVYSGPKLQRMTIRALRRDGAPDDGGADRPPRPRPRGEKG